MQCVACNTCFMMHPHGSNAGWSSDVDLEHLYLRMGLEYSVGGLMGNGLPHKETCAGCQLPIEDRFLLRVMENSWHEHCLQCSICGEPLTRSCYVKDRKFFCKVDYDKYYGTKCSGCLQSIPSNELVMRALGSVFHLRCFVCVICGHQLQKGDQFVIKDGHLYCRLDFEKEYALMQTNSQTNWYAGGFSPRSDDESSVDENQQENSKAPKRPRTILTTSQRRKFKASFEINPKPCRKVRETLAAETGLSVRVVQVWFQNQRAKVKKLARRQSPGEGGENGPRKNNHNRNNKRKPPKDDDNSDGSLAPSEGSLHGECEVGPPIMSDNQMFASRMQPFDVHKPQGSMYSGPGMNDSMYEGSMGMDDGLNNLDEVLMTQQPNQVNPEGTVANPIDKLYSMQSSYFNAE